jgi:hypothetical protein
MVALPGRGRGAAAVVVVEGEGMAAVAMGEEDGAGAGCAVVEGAVRWRQRLEVGDDPDRWGPPARERERRERE